jgi:hypothetical protein
MQVSGLRLPQMASGKDGRQPANVIQSVSELGAHGAGRRPRPSLAAAHFDFAICQKGRSLAAPRLAIHRQAGCRDHMAAGAASLVRT